MANEKISDLPAGGPAQSNDAVPIARAGSNYQLAVSNFTAGPTGPTGPQGPGGNGFDLAITGNTTGTTSLISTGTMVFSGGNNITLSQNGQSIGISAFNQSVQTQASGNIGATGFATTTIAGTAIAGTNNTAGFTLAVPPYLTTQSVQTQASGNIGATGFATTTIAGTAVAGTNNTAGFTLGVPPYLTTQSVQTQASGAIAGTGVTTTTQGGSTLGVTQNTAGLSLAVPAWVTAGGGGGGLDVTLGGNTSGTLALISTGTMFLAGGSNITLSQNGNSVTISGATAAGLTTGGIYAAGNTTGQSSSSTYQQTALNVSFAGIITGGWSSNSLIISAPASTGISQSLYATGNTTLTSSGTASIGSLLVSGAGNVTVGVSSGTLVISGAGSGGGAALSIGGNSTSAGAGYSNITSGTAVLLGGNNITLSQNGASITVSGASQSVQTQASGNIAATGFATTTIAGTAIAGTNNTTGFTLAVPPYLTTQSVQTLASGAIAGTGVTTTTQAGSTLGITQNTAGLSVAVPAWLTAAAGATGVAVQVSNTTYTSGTVNFSNANGITFGSTAGGVTASYNSTQFAGTGTSATNASVTLNSAGLQISVGAGGGASTAGLFATGNTTNGSTTTLALSSQLYNFQGAMTGGFSNGSIQISAPATSSLSVSGNLSLSVNASTISIGGIGAGTGFTTGSTTGIIGAVTVNTAGISSVDAYLTRYVHPPGQLTAITAPGNASMTVQYVPIPNPLTGTRLDALVAMSAGSTITLATAGIALSAYAIIYTKNANTLSSLSSGSTQTTYTYASNSAGATWLTNSAIYGMSVPINFNMAPGEYYVGFNLLTNTTSIGLTITNLGLTLSMMGGNALQTALNYAELGSNTGTSSNLNHVGVYSAATTGVVSGVSISAINQTGTAQSAGNIALVFRNG